MSDVVEFLTACLDEDEQLARQAAGFGDGDTLLWPEWIYDREHFRVLVEGTAKVRVDKTTDVDGTHIARHDPARILREVAAKRRMLALHGSMTIGGGPHEDGLVCLCCGDTTDDYLAVGWPCDTVRLLAAAYADHPDYDSAWAIDVT